MNLKTKNHVQLGYHLMMIIATRMPEYQVIQGFEIVRYLSDNQKHDVDIEAENDELVQIRRTDDELRNHQRLVVTEYYKKSNEQQQVDLLIRINSMIESHNSNRAKVEQYTRLGYVAGYFGIDIKPLLQPLDLQMI